MYTNLNGKFEALDSHVKKLDIQISQSASSSRGSYKKQHQPCHTVTLRSRKQLEPVVKKGLSSEDNIDMEEVEDDVISKEILSTSTDAQSPCRSTWEVIQTRESAHVDRHTSCVGRHKDSRSPISPETTPQPVERVYKPKIPYPMIPRKSKQEIEEASLKAVRIRL